jgi:hypothetical protein
MNVRQPVMMMNQGKLHGTHKRNRPQGTRKTKGEKHMNKAERTRKRDIMRKK